MLIPQGLQLRMTTSNAFSACSPLPSRLPFSCVADSECTGCVAAADADAEVVSVPVKKIAAVAIPRARLMRSRNAKVTGSPLMIPRWAIHHMRPVQSKRQKLKTPTGQLGCAEGSRMG